MKVYISGPMRGYPSFNYPLFHEAAAWLRDWGYKALNPVEINADLDGTGAEFSQYMRRDLTAVAMADAILLLPGWRGSIGANVELINAIALGLKTGIYPSDVEAKTFSDVRPRFFETDYPQPNYVLLGRELRNKQEVPA